MYQKKVLAGVFVFCVSLLLLVNISVLVFAQADDPLADARKEFEEGYNESKRRIAENQELLDQMLAQQQQAVVFYAGPVFLFVVVFGLISFIAFIWAIIDIVQASNEINWKILWAVICIFLGIIGVLIYYFVGRNQKTAAKKKKK